MNKFWLVLSLIFGTIIFITGTLIAMFGGANSFLTFVFWLIVILGIITIIFLIGLAIWWIFQPQHIDGIKLNKKRVLKSALLHPPDFKQLLYFKGFEEFEFRKIGTIMGVSQIKTTKINDKGKEVQVLEDCIAFKRASPFSWFAPHEVVRVFREERTSFNADIVYLKAMCFTPELFGFLYLPSRFRDNDMVTKQINAEIKRYSGQEILKEEINLIQDALAISPAHQKRLEQQNIQGIRASQSNNNGGGQQ